MLNRRSIIGKILAIYISLPIVKFKPIKSDLLAIGKVYFSTEQKYMLEKLQVVSIGSTDISCKCPGTISEAKLITILNRIFKLYIGTAKPSFEFVILSEILRIS